MNAEENLSETSSRKCDHIRLCLECDVGFHENTNGLERWEFEHNALPEININEIDTTTTFLGKKLSFPFMISGMTGGYPEALKINASLATVSQEIGIALGVGSQRQVLEDATHRETYTIARINAPDIPLIANIGVTETAKMTDSSSALALVEMIEADALAVHCNALQEFLQPEGTPEFKGALAGIERLVRELPVPVIVKEVGAGISASVARRLFDAGVQWIDIAGAGGTSWAAVEMLRREDALSPSFREWGIPLANALVSIMKEKPSDVSLIASGGITDGVMIAKSIALGASLAGAARAPLQHLMAGGEKKLQSVLLNWKNDLRGVMFLTGVKNVEDLRRVPIFQRENSR